MSVIIFIVILLVLVLSHEFGHFIVAKKSGVRVDEFSFGFPPKLFGKKIGETEYNFNLLPLGGYVKIHGEDAGDIDDLDKDRSLEHKPWYIKAAVLVAGVTMNFLVAWLLLSIGFISGLPTSVEMAPVGSRVNNAALTIVNVSPNSPALKAGMKSGDKILSVSVNNNTNMASIVDGINTESIHDFVLSHPTDQINFSLMRGNKLEDISVKPSLLNGSDTPMVGISMDMIGTLSLPVHRAVWEGLKLTSSLTVKTAVGLYGLLKDSLMGHGNLSSVTGPIGIVGIVGDAVNFGFIYLISFMALISINLVVINMIPFPALDGGRLLFLLIEKIKGSKIKKKIANAVNLIGFSLLMILMLVITYNDIMKLF